MTDELLDLRWLRSWKTWGLVVVQVGLGIQYLVAPQRALAAPTLHQLQYLGVIGWQVVAVLFILLGLMLTPFLICCHPYARASWLTGFVGSGVLWLWLVYAAFIHGYWPGTMLLAAWLYVGEIATLGADRRRR